MNSIHTFVICAYKESVYLEECIKSVICQREYSDVILATSTPSGYISDLCQKYNISMYVNEGEKGITQDWEFALSLVKTPIATITHQDDIYYKNYAKKLVGAYIKNPNMLIFFSDYHEIRNGMIVKNNKILSIKRFMLLPLRFDMLKNSKWVRRMVLSFGCPICCPSVGFCLENLPRPLFFNHFRTNEDWEAWERYSMLDGAFIYEYHPLMAHRIHSESETSAAINDTGRGHEDYEMFRKFWPDSIARLLTEKYKKSEKSNTV